MAIDLEAARAEFPVARRLAYLNHAAAGPISLRAARAIEAVAREQAEYGMLREGDWARNTQEARRAAARLLEAAPEQIAFIKNTSEGISLAANGLDWKAGDNVVLPAIEFPSNLYPWMNLERWGVETRLVAVDGSGAGLDALAGAIDGRTRVIALSAVQFSTGHRYDLARIGALCRSRGLLFVVDGIQALGALRIRPEAADIDVLAADAHKWLLGPNGIGIAWFSARAMAQLRPSEAGWLSVREPYAFHGKLDWLPDARRFEPGTENTAGIAGLGAAINLILDYGPDQIEARVLALADRLRAGAEARGYAALSPSGAARSGIVIVRNLSVDNLEARDRLRDAGVLVSVRGGGIRFSPHFYNSEAEIDHAVAALPPG